MKISLFQPALPHYRIPIFLFLSKNPELSITVFYGQNRNLANVPTDQFPATSYKSLRFKVFGETFVFSSRWIYEALFGDYDVFIFTWDVHFLSLAPATLLAKLRGKKVILWGHGYSKKEKPHRKALRYFVGKLASCVLVYSDSIADLLIKDGWDPKKVFSAPNTISQTEIQSCRKFWFSHPEQLKAFQRKHGLIRSKMILFCSRLERANNVELLIRAHSLLRKKDKNIRLVVIGDGPDLPRLKEIARSLGTSESTSFLGPIYEEKELAPWFLSAGAYCYPRNIGLSILHSFGYGLPVVTSDDIKSHNPEIEALHDQKNGFLYRDGDIEDMAVKIKLLLDNPSLRKKLGSVARKIALEEYTIPKMAAGMVDAIQSTYQSGNE